jgi:hypothetical protein
VFSRDGPLCRQIAWGEHIAAGKARGLFAGEAHHVERGFASMHIYHVASGTSVVTILRPARTTKGTEVRTVVKHVTKRLKQHRSMPAGQPRRGDGLGGGQRNRRRCRARRRGGGDRRYCAFTCDQPYGNAEGELRLECSLQPVAGETGMRQEVDIRYALTSLEDSAQRFCENVYCQRGQMENLIKLHKAQSALNRSCATRNGLIRCGSVFTPPRSRALPPRRPRSEPRLPPP